MSASSSMYVPFFRCESCPYISRRADWFPCALFPFHFPCAPLVFISVPFMSLSVPFVSLSFPVAFLSCRLPMSSPHFLALPCISPLLPSISRNKTRFCQRFRMTADKNAIHDYQPSRLRCVRDTKEIKGSLGFSPLMSARQ